MKTEVKDLGGGWKQVTEFFDSGKVSSIHKEFKGRIYGEKVYYFEGGNIAATELFYAGTIHGDSFWYYEDGRLERKYIWRDGVCRGREDYDDTEPDGQIEDERITLKSYIKARAYKYRNEPRALNQAILVLLRIKWGIFSHKIKEMASKFGIIRTSK